MGVAPSSSPPSASFPANNDHRRSDAEFEEEASFASRIRSLRERYPLGDDEIRRLLVLYEDRLWEEARIERRRRRAKAGCDVVVGERERSIRRSEKDTSDCVVCAEAEAEVGTNGSADETLKLQPKPDLEIPEPSFLTLAAAFCAAYEDEGGVGFISGARAESRRYGEESEGGAEGEPPLRSELEAAAARMMLAAEDRILPPCFGDALWRTLFLLGRDDVIAHCRSGRGVGWGGSSFGEGTSPTPTPAEHLEGPLAPARSYLTAEDMRILRLERFLRGVADGCGRRGSRLVLGALFRCCAQARALRERECERSSRGASASSEDDKDIEDDSLSGGGSLYASAAAMEAAAVGGDAFSTASFASCSSSSSPFDASPAPASAIETASAAELLDAARRLSLAAAFLLASYSGGGGGGVVGVGDGSALDEGGYRDPSNCVPHEEEAGGLPSPLAASLIAHAAEGGKANAGMGFARVTFVTATTSTAVVSASSATARDGDVDLDTFLSWAEWMAPCLCGSLPTFLHRVLFPQTELPPAVTPLVHPELGRARSAFFQERACPRLFALACFSPSLGGTWHRLYSSNEDGLSFNRLLHSLLGYGGPTLLIVRVVGGDGDGGGGVFGAFTSSSWRESGDHYGDSDCFLYRLEPSAAVYRPRGGGAGVGGGGERGRGSNGRNFVYCNPSSRSRGYDGLAHGIGFGGTPNRPRLFVDESFEECVAAPADTTFEPGPLLPPSNGMDGMWANGVEGGGGGGGGASHFDVADLEVWAVGGDKAIAVGLSARARKRDVMEANIRKARKVDKAQFLDDFKSGVIESKAFQHRAQIQGRADCDLDHKDSGKY